MSKHKGIFLHKAPGKLYYTDSPCLDMIFLSLILPTNRKMNVLYLLFEIKKKKQTPTEKCLQMLYKEGSRKKRFNSNKITQAL